MTTTQLFPPLISDFATSEYALGPLDGRYRRYISPLVNYLSEPALNRARVLVEVEWLIFLADKKVIDQVAPFTKEEQDYLRLLVSNFGKKQIERLAEIEAKTKHDVKAVEYLIQEHLQAAARQIPGTKLPEYLAMVHIFCTSEDINNLSYALCIHDAVTQVWLPQLLQLTAQLTELAHRYAEIPMLAHTHGQAATPVTLGKELAVFVHRLQRQICRIKKTDYLGKINGATGTWAAHQVSIPTANWPDLAKEFIAGLGLTPNLLTTQIESHDWQAELFSDVARVNRILHNFATDVWTYISMGYFHQNLQAQGSTGSSTMPHKVNPIRFENAEANLEISSALLDTLSATLVTSRMQRDLTDSTTQRNIGVAFGHSLLALHNLQTGLAGLEVNQKLLATDLEQNWEVLGEAIQQVMRVAGLNGTSGMENPYERLKELTRDQKVNADSIRTFIQSLGLSHEDESRLLELSPASYIGYSHWLANQVN